MSLGTVLIWIFCLYGIAKTVELIAELAWPHRFDRLRDKMYEDIKSFLKKAFNQIRIFARKGKVLWIKIKRKFTRK